MQEPLRKSGIVLGMIFSVAWPALVGGLLGGWQGIRIAAFAYLLLGGLLLTIMVVGGIRGILGS